MLARLLSAKSGSAEPVGQQSFTAAGTFSFVVPDGVTSICAVAVGGGGRSHTRNLAGSGGALAYANDIPVTAGETLTIINQTAPTSFKTQNTTGTRLRRGSTTLLFASAGSSYTPASGTAALSVGEVKFSGGRPGARRENSDGDGSGGGGGGAAGYTQNGGNGQSATSSSTPRNVGGGGGGVGLFGGAEGGTGGREGRSGGAGGAGGSGGTAGATRGRGGQVGGGDGINGTALNAGALRIIWGPNRAFPSLNTDNQV